MTKLAGRRFWPIKCGTIQINNLIRDRDQLFAEAVDAYRKDYQWWPHKDLERKLITPEQDDRYEADEAWEEAIAEFLADKSETTVGKVASQGLGIEKPRIGTADSHRISKALKRLGWKRGKREPGTGKRLWVPKRVTQ